VDIIASGIVILKKCKLVENGFNEKEMIENCLKRRKLKKRNPGQK
jgi:hypothetical protein